MVLLVLGAGGVRRRGGGLFGGECLLWRAVLSRSATLALGRLKRRRSHGGGGRHGVRVDHVRAAIAARKEAVRRRGRRCRGGGGDRVVELVVVVVMVVVEEGAELVLIGFHTKVLEREREGDCRERVCVECEFFYFFIWKQK